VFSFRRFSSLVEQQAKVVGGIHVTRGHRLSVVDFGFCQVAAVHE
jgi:hypothetical protein